MVEPIEGLKGDPTNEAKGPFGFVALEDVGIGVFNEKIPPPLESFGFVRSGDERVDGFEFIIETVSRFMVESFFHGEAVKQEAEFYARAIQMSEMMWLRVMERYGDEKHRVIARSEIKRRLG